MTQEQYEEIDARLIALETIIAHVAGLAEAKDIILTILQEQIASMRTLNSHAAAIETYGRVSAMLDSDASLPPDR